MDFYKPTSIKGLMHLAVALVLLLFVVAGLVGITQSITRAHGPQGAIDAQREYIKACENSQSFNGQGGVPDVHTKTWTCTKPH